MSVATKWIALTIIVGVSLVNATDAPTKLLIDPEIPSFTNDKLGITIENLSTTHHQQSSRRQLRNLIPPYQEFSSLDSVQFIDSKSRNSKNLPSTFGSFREPSTLLIRTSSPSPFRRRSDEYDDSIGTYPASQIAFDLNEDFDYANEDNATIALRAAADVEQEQYKKFQNKIIPISFAPQVYANDDVQQRQPKQDDDNNSDSAASDEKSLEIERGGKLLADNDGDSADKKIRFPEQNASDSENQPMPRAEALTARRSGIQFSENESQVRQHNFNPFVPLSYSEESLNFGDTISNLQRPYHSDDGELNENERVGNRYYRPFVVPFRDEEVTKFGDANGGPVTGFNRPIRDFSSGSSDSVVFFPRTQYESTGSAAYFEPESSRPPRHFVPSKVYTEYPDYVQQSSASGQQQQTAKYYQAPATYSWKSRQPRVVFPAAATTTDFGPGTTYVGNDNVVFR